MAYDAVLKPQQRPENYRPPEYRDVDKLLGLLKRQRQPVIDRIWRIKRVRRRQWDDVLRLIPKSYRKMLVVADAPQFEDQLRRLAGLVAKHEPMFEVLPPSGRPPDVAKASKEELRLHSTRMQIADQQDRDPYAMGIDAQIAWGESWIAVWPDPNRFSAGEYKREKDEPAEKYLDRTSQLMADGGVPIIMCDYAPESVFPFRGDDERLKIVIIETEHELEEIGLGYGYHPVKNTEGKVVEWFRKGHSLSEPFVAQDSRTGEMAGVVDITHDRGQDGSSQPSSPIRKVIYIDQWCYQMYLDEVLVEQWEHNFGVVPVFPAYGSQTSDRDPAYQSSGLLDPIVSVAKQVVLYSAMLASNSMLHAWPTPFLKNPEHGLVNPLTGQPLTRSVQLGELNLLGAQEEIEFPYLQAQMMPDFFKYMDYLSGQLDEVGIGGLAKALGSEMSGYAIAQIRSQQMAVLAPVYSNASRQWRKIGYFIRHLVRNVFPAGFYLRGAVEENEDGVQYRPILRYGPEHCTEFTINAHIDEGIRQDEIAERKSAIELGQAGYWSSRRVMEKTGVEDPDAEKREIDTDRVLSSPAADEVVLRMAVQMAAERYEATRQEMSSPFYQALEEAKRTYMGGGGQFANQGGEPVNALPGGQPMGQNPSPDTPQAGGPMAGAPAEGIDMHGLGQAQLPGGVRGVQQAPVGAPG